MVEVFGMEIFEYFHCGDLNIFLFEFLPFAESFLQISLYFQMWLHKETLSTTSLKKFETVGTFYRFYTLQPGVMAHLDALNFFNVQACISPFLYTEEVLLLMCSRL